MKKRKIIGISMYVLLAIIIGVIAIVTINQIRNNKSDHLYSATILEKIEQKENASETGVITLQYMAIITDEPYENRTVKVEDSYDSLAPYHLVANVGDEVLLYLEYDEHNEIQNAFLSGFKRDKPIMYLIGIFVLLILVVGKIKGLKSLLSLVVTLLLIFKVFLPGVLAGKDPILLSILISLVITVVTMLIISGISKKTLSTILGTVLGVVVGGLIAILISSQASIIGLTYEEANFLVYLPQGTVFNFSGLLFATIIIGALGAVMDVSMSISSSIEEIQLANPQLTKKQLFKSGMNIGRDVMGTMVNTLILAYVGSSIHLMILFLAYQTPITEILNNDSFVTEIVRAFAGTIGLIAAIPLTALISTQLSVIVKRD